MKTNTLADGKRNDVQAKQKVVVRRADGSKIWSWEVTGYGPSKLPGIPAKDSRGRWTGWERVTVLANTMEEAIALACGSDE